MKLSDLSKELQILAKDFELPEDFGALDIIHADYIGDDNEENAMPKMLKLLFVSGLIPAQIEESMLVYAVRVASDMRAAVMYAGQVNLAIRLRPVRMLEVAGDKAWKHMQELEETFKKLEAYVDIMKYSAGALAVASSLSEFKMEEAIEFMEGRAYFDLLRTLRSKLNNS